MPCPSTLTSMLSIVTLRTMAKLLQSLEGSSQSSMFTAGSFYEFEELFLPGSWREKGHI